MNITLNLTPVLITLIICIALYKICKLPKNDTNSGNAKSLKEAAPDNITPYTNVYAPNFDRKDNSK